MGLDAIRNEIEHMRRQILRQRKEIRALQRAGIPTKSAEELLERMQTKVDGLCVERARQVGDQRRTYLGTNKVIIGPIARQPALDPGARRCPAHGAARRLLLPPCAGDHALDRPICGNRFGQPGVLFEQAAQHRREGRQDPLAEYLNLFTPPPSYWGGDRRG
jgi:hypothetical protein